MSQQPASRQLLNVTKEVLDHCEAECEQLRARLEAAGILIGQLGEANAELAEVLKQCADKLAASVESFYQEAKHYPDEQRRYQRDMAPVHRARAAIAKSRG